MNKERSTAVADVRLDCTLVRAFDGGLFQTSILYKHNDNGFYTFFLSNFFTTNFWIQKYFLHRCL